MRNIIVISNNLRAKSGKN